MYSSPLLIFFQTSDHAQGGGLTTAGGANQNDELLVGDLQVEVLNGGNVAGVDLVDMTQANACHGNRHSFLSLTVLIVFC